MAWFLPYGFAIRWGMTGFQPLDMVDFQPWGVLKC